MTALVECPHEPGDYLCDDCLELTYLEAHRLSRLADWPSLRGVSERSVNHATLVRWRSVSKHGAAINDLVIVETEASWWLDNQSGLSRGKLSGRVGQLLEESRLRVKDPVEAKRRELTAVVKRAEKELAAARNQLRAEISRKLAKYLIAVETAKSRLSDFESEAQ